MLCSYEELCRNAAKMRKYPTYFEQLAFNKLETRGKKYFEFQKPFGIYILDFVIPSKGLIIEVDGSSHLYRERYDLRRDMFCNECGLKVRRIENYQAVDILKYVDGYPDIQNADYVVKRAFAVAKERRECLIRGEKEKALNPIRDYKKLNNNNKYNKKK